MPNIASRHGRYYDTKRVNRDRPKMIETFVVFSEALIIIIIITRWGQS
jgi:hypothetical protein